MVELVEKVLGEHSCLALLNEEGFAETGFDIKDASRTLYFIREIGKTKGGNPKVGKRKVLINFCPSCGKNLKEQEQMMCERIDKKPSTIDLYEAAMNIELLKATTFERDSALKQVGLLREALNGLVDVIAYDLLIPESVSYMKQARHALAMSKELDQRAGVDGLKITATKVKAREIKPGELFSTEGQFYWDHFDPFGVGEKVYIRTNKSASKEQGDQDIYRIEIFK